MTHQLRVGKTQRLVEVAKWRQRNSKSKDMSHEEVQTLLKAIDEVGDTQFGHYIRFLLYTAARRNEILYLKREDLDLENLSLDIKAEKISNELTLPINNALKKVIDSMDLPGSGYIFQTRCNRTSKKKIPWHPCSVTHQFKLYIRKANLPDHYSLHSLRHTYATFLRQKGVPLDIVQKLLGHSSPRTTSENYDHSIALHFREQANLVDFEED